MEILKKLCDDIKKFFTLVESHESVIQNCIQKAKKPLHSITNESVFYRSIAAENSVVNTPFENIEGFREAHLDTVFTSLQEQYNYLVDIRNEINTANEKLLKEQKLLENQYSELISKGLTKTTNLNPCCPSLEHIIEWSHDIWCYYHSFYLQISQELLKLNYEQEFTVKALVESFSEDIELKKNINRIRSFKFDQFEFIV